VPTLLGSRNASRGARAVIVPDYRGGSIVNLMASIAQALGAEMPIYPPLRSLSSESLASRSIALVMIDGLGHDYLLAQRPGGALVKHLQGRMTTVFPATTAAAVTTFLTGLAPQQHAVTGWFTYFRELGTVLAPLPYRPRCGGARPSVAARLLFAHVPIFDRLSAACHVVMPEHIVRSEFNSAHQGRAQPHAFARLGQMFQAVARIVRRGAGRNYIYAYWPELDRLAHEHGIASREAAAHLAQIDAAFGDFIASIEGTGTTVIVTADHGFIDALPEQAVELEAHPELGRTLALPLCGERRAAYCYVRPDCAARFKDYVRTHLEERAEVRASEELIELGCFGLGPPHPRLHERVGDYILLMKGSAVIKDWLLGETRYSHVGVHGGTTPAEMYVPLIIAQA
jgi:hypothetical protein